jgi:hypothetical protein
VAGSFVSVKPSRALSVDTDVFDLRFDAPLARLTPGQALKECGEAKGKVLLSLLAAAKIKQWPALKTQ